MKKILYTTILMLLPNIIVASEWYAIGDVKLNERVIEDKLWVYLLDGATAVFKSRDTYSYQYIDKGNNIIYINSFCNTWDREELNTEFLVVKDGGSCYFHVQYNKKTGKFFNLMVNGES